MIQPVFEFAKVAALAALAALIAVHWLAPLDASLIGVAALWLLVARIT